MQLVFKRRVDGVPELAAAGGDLAEVLGCRRTRWGCGETRGDVGRERGVEGIEAVDSSGDAVEADALEADFAYELGRWDLRVGVASGSNALENRQRVWGVESKRSRGLSNAVN